MKRIAKHLVNTEEDMLRETEFLSTIENQILPNNWCWISLKSIASILNGFAFKSDHYSVDGIRVIRITNVQDGFIEDNSPIFYPIETKKEIEKYLLQEDDLLISLTGNVGRVALLPASLLPAALNQRVGCIRTNDSIVSKKYLFYLFQGESFQKDCVKNAKGSAQLNMSTEWLKEQSVPLAPFPEQQRIVDRIESLFVKLDEAKEKAQAVIDGYEDRRAAILHKAFTGELTRTWAAQQGISLDAWQTKRFDDVAEVKSNLVDPAEYPDLPHIAPDNIEKKTGKLLDYHTVAEDAVKSGKHRFYAGQILYSKIRPNLSKVVVIDCDGLCSADMYPIEPKDGVNTKFLWYYMLSDDFVLQASTAGSRSVLPKINQKELASLKIQITELKEQEKVVAVLDKFFEKEQQAKGAAEQVLDQIDSMKKSILARAFRGELGSNDPNDEPAIELLKRTL